LQRIGETNWYHGLVRPRRACPWGSIEVMRIKRITSESNTAFKTFLRLRKAQGIKKYGMAILSGPKQVKEALSEFADLCAGIIVSDIDQVPEGIIRPDLPLYVLSPVLFNAIDFYDTGYAILLIHVAPFSKWSGDSLAQGCTLCIPFQDPVNVGAVIRAAAAFGVAQVVMLKEAAHPFHPKSIRTAGSNIFRVTLLEGPSLRQLKVSGLPLITLSPKGRDVGGHTFPQAFCLIPGLEGPGLPHHLRQSTSLSIPMVKGVESLNSAMATGIILYLWRNGLGKGGPTRGVP